MKKNYLKFIGFVIIPIVIISVFISCNNDKSSVNNEVKKFSFSSFSTKKKITFSTLQDFPQGNPEKIIILDTNLLLINSLNQNDSYFLYLVTTNGNLKKEFLKKGSGPNEAISLSSIGLLANKFYGYDITKNELIWCFKDSLLKNNTINFSKSSLKQNRYYDLVYYNDSVVVGSGDPLSDKKISFYNIFTKKVIGEFGNFPINYEGSLGAFKDAATSYIDIRPDCKRFLLTYRYTDIIEIYDEKGKLLIALQGPQGINLSYIPDGDIAQKTEKTIKAFVNTFVTNSNIYLLFTGNTKRDKSKWIYGDMILVLNWDGQLKELWELNERIYTFAVDETRNVIYSNSEKGEIIKADLE